MRFWFRVAVVTASVGLAVAGTAVAGQAAPSPHAKKLTVNAGSTTDNVDAALGDGAAIAGQVTDIDANPLQLAQVEVLTPSGRNLGSTSTDSSGDYRVGSLPAGSYVVCVNAAQASSAAQPASYGYVSMCNGSASAWSPSDPPSSDARHIATSLGSTATANLVLTEGGAIAGTITSRGGKDLTGYAELFTPGGASLGTAFANNGTYQFNGLPARSYVVCFQPPVTSGPTGYAPACYHDTVWYDNGVLPAKATRVSVSAGAEKVVNQSLAPGGAVTGTVRSKTTSKPLRNAVVDVYVHGRSAGYADANSKGAYRIRSLPAGTYKVCAVALRQEMVILGPSLSSYGLPRDEFAPAGAADGVSADASSSHRQCWQQQASLKQAATVHVHERRTTSGINFKVSPYSTPKASISGHVKTRSGASVADSLVVAFDSKRTFFGGALTNKHGQYHLAVPPSSKSGYLVCAIGPQQLPEAALAASPQLGARCWKDAPWSEDDLPKGAKAVPVGAKQHRTGIDIALPAAGRIIGAVTYGGQPAPDVQVEVYGPLGDQLATAFTDTNGNYSVDVSPSAHAYRVCFATRQEFTTTPTLSPTYGFAPQCYDNQPWNESGVF